MNFGLRMMSDDVFGASRARPRHPCCAMIFGGRLLALLALAEHASAQRVLHWVIRVSSLEETLAFTTDVLGMKVLRHEENAEPCPRARYAVSNL